MLEEKSNSLYTKEREKELETKIVKFAYYTIFSGMFFSIFPLIYFLKSFKAEYLLLYFIVLCPSILASIWLLKNKYAN